MHDQKKRTWLLLFGVFLISGFCGLLYQIVWLRLAFTAFGVVTPVLSVVISVFMLGLAGGSWFGGKYIRQISARTGLSAIYFYALAEFVIGVGGLLAGKLFVLGQTILLSAGNYDSFVYLLFSGFILALSILPWCFAMGATIPLMLAFIQELGYSDQKSFSFLYLANVIGAMLGAYLTAECLIELFGFSQTQLIAVAFNLTIAVVAVALGLRLRNKLVPGLADENGETGAAPVRVWSSSAPYLLFLTGFTSMAMEVVWTRAFTFVLSTTVYTYAAILTTYLLATWLGSWLYRRQARVQKDLDLPSIIMLLALSCFLPLIFCDPHVSWLFSRGDLRVAGNLALASIFPFCALLGYLLPKLIDQRSLGDPGVAGRLYAINVVGCIFGPLCAAYLLLPWLGVKFSLLILALPYLGYFGYYFKALGRNKPKVAAVSAVIILGLLGTSIIRLESFENIAYGKPIVVRRDYVATVVSFGAGLDKGMRVNGVGITNLTTITKCMAHIPLAIRKKPPESALVICFGMGTTFRSAAAWGIKATAVELVPGVRDAFGFYFADADRILKNKKVRIVVDDGRRYLLRSTEKYDLITLDPPPPVEADSSGLLYSEEFYRLAKKRLQPGGILAQWFPGGELTILKGITRAISKEFPYVKVYKSVSFCGFHYFASETPFTMPAPREFSRRLPPQAAADLTEWAPGYSAEKLYALILQHEVPLPQILTPDVTYSLTDDRPLNEYYKLRRMESKTKNFY
jgi:spermidine synthase